MNGTDERSLKDVTFLRAIRDINGSPARYASTEQGVTPATVTAITEATMLTEEAVESRFDSLRQGKEGLVEVYEAGQQSDCSASVDSAELTAAGEQSIAETQQQEESPDVQEAPDAQDVPDEQAAPDQHDPPDAQAAPDQHDPPDEQEARGAKDAQDEQKAPGAQDEQSRELPSEFDDMGAWDPADVDTGSDDTAIEEVPADEPSAANESRIDAKPPNDPQMNSTEQSAANTESAEESTADMEPTGTDETDARLETLEARIEQLEAENAESAPKPVDTSESSSVDAERVDELAEEVAALRETTDRLESTLDDALADIDAIRDSEYGAIAEKRKKQFETAVKSMVAFHQLATEVLDVRVENYEPSAGRADSERVEITRNRIGDALGIGKSGGGSGDVTLDSAIDSGDSDWPDPGEVASGGGTFSLDDEELVSAPDDERETDGSERDEPGPDDPDLESDAPESGVYPPVGGSRGAERDGATEADATGEEVDEDESGSDSEAPETGVYPPIGDSGTSSDDADAAPGESADATPAESADATPGESTDATPAESADATPAESEDASSVESDDADSDEDEPRASADSVYPPIGGNDEESVEGLLPESLRPEADVEGNITATAADEGHVVDPVRSTGEKAPVERLPLDIDAGESLALHRAVTSRTAEASPATWRLVDVDPATALDVREAAVAARAGAGAEDAPTYDDPYPDGEAYARIVGEDAVDDSSEEHDLPTNPSPVDPAKVRMADGQGTESDSTKDEDSPRNRSDEQDDDSGQRQSGGQNDDSVWYPSGETNE